MASHTVGVVGCGLMGSGIAQVSAIAGFRTIVREVDQTLVDRGLRRIEDFLTAGVTRGKTSAEEKDRALANLSGTTRLDAFADCDFVIEAIVEKRRGQARGLCGARRSRRSGSGVRVEYVVAVYHGARSGDEAARSVHRDALFQPGAGDGAGRGDPAA